MDKIINNTGMENWVKDLYDHDISHMTIPDGSVLHDMIVHVPDRFRLLRNIVSFIYHKDNDIKVVYEHRDKLPGYFYITNRNGNTTILVESRIYIFNILIKTISYE